MAEAIDTGTMMLLAGVIVVAIVVGGFIFKKKGTKFKEFVPIPVEKIYTSSLDKKLKGFGHKLKKGKIVLGYQHKFHIDRFMTIRSKFPMFEYDPNEKDHKPILDKEGEVITNQADFIIFRLKAKFFLWRWFGIKKSYMIIREKDEDGKPILKFDDSMKRFILPQNIDFFMYGNIWTESIHARDYLNNVSMLFELQAQQTHLVNTPDRFIHLEKEQIKRENLLKTTAEIDRKKYEEIKRAEDEVIS